MSMNSNAKAPTSESEERAYNYREGGECFSFLSHLFPGKREMKRVRPCESNLAISVSSSALPPKLWDLQNIDLLCWKSNTSCVSKRHHLRNELPCPRINAKPVLPGQLVMSSLCGWICILLL